MSRVQVVDTRKKAERTFEVFHDRKHRNATELPFGWPKRMQEIGVGGAEMYRSNKWQKKLSEYEEYKHVVEGTRTVYAHPGFLVEDRRPERKIPVVGPMVEFVEPMPKHFTRLGPLLGLHIRCFEETASGELVIPKANKNRYEVRIARAFLGAATHPETDEVFLFAYDAQGVHVILTGGSLTIGKDGIAG